MEFLKIIGITVVVVTFLSFLKQYHASYAVLASLAFCVVLLTFTLQSFSPLLAVMEQFAVYAKWEELQCVLKAAGLAILTQMTQELCRDAGHAALAGRVELAGRTAMLLAALPLFVSLADILMVLL